MCGIAGFTGGQNPKLLKKMLFSIKHRGPDEQIEFYDGQINAGMQRLSIIDLRKKLYPMKYKNLLLLYNGEIYNHKNLREDLKKNGIKFKTNSDAEVILPLFDLYGTKSFSMLEGMFAIFIYDLNGTLYLARDQSGEKPLYYTKNSSLFSFSSELKALMLIADLNNEFDNKSLAGFFFQGHVFAPNTVLKKIKKIPPGNYLKMNLNNKKYFLSSYLPSFNRIQNRKTSEANLKKKLEFLINNSVEKRLMADVGVGCFLSGGVDSSLITYFASRYVKKLPTYSISFPGYDKYDETKFALQAAKICHSKHTIVPCTAEKIRPMINNIGELIDEPIIDAAFLPLCLLAKEASKKVKVILTGDGSDEIFAGYQRYRNELIIERIRQLIKFISFSQPLIKSFFPEKFHRLSRSLKESYSSQKIWNEEMLTGLLINPKNFDFKKRVKNKISDPLLLMQKTDLKGFLAEQLLMKTDKATMACSLETRLPYLAPSIIDFALNLPSSYKLNKIHGKYLLKKVAENYFPSSFVWRKKQGFSVPLNHWFREELKDIVYDSVKDLKKINKYCNHKYYKLIVDKHILGTADYADQIWSIIVLTKFINYHHL